MKQFKKWKKYTAVNLDGHNGFSSEDVVSSVLTL